VRVSVLDGFGVDLIKQIWSEIPGVWTGEFGDEVVDLTTADNALTLLKKETGIG
jgi:hypothetical protein